jgi:hypothetical protein
MQSQESRNHFIDPESQKKKKKKSLHYHILPTRGRGCSCSSCRREARLRSRVNSPVNKQTVNAARKLP